MQSIAESMLEARGNFQQDYWKRKEFRVKKIVVADYINTNKKANNLTFDNISNESGVPLSTVNAYSKGLVNDIAVKILWIEEVFELELSSSEAPKILNILADVEHPNPAPA